MEFQAGEMPLRCELIPDCEFIDALMERMEELGSSAQLSEEERQRLAEGVADLPQNRRGLASCFA